MPECRRYFSSMSSPKCVQNALERVRGALQKRVATRDWRREKTKSGSLDSALSPKGWGRFPRFARDKRDDNRCGHAPRTRAQAAAG